MAKKGALKSVYIVNDDDLRVNGGRWLLQSGPAIRVRGFTADTLGDRKVTGGDALPIYVLGENDIRANGGQFLLKGGQPISVTSAIATARGVIQGKAIPVWPVDDDENFDPTFAGLSAYAVKVLTFDPIVYWPLWETSGNIAEDISGNGNNGQYTGVLLGQPGIGDGRTAPFFDGTSDFVDILFGGFGPLFNGAEGSISIWGIVENVGVWTDGDARDIVRLREGLASADLLIIRKLNPSQLQFRYSTDTAGAYIFNAATNDINWFHAAITWSQAGALTEFYFNGAVVGPSGNSAAPWGADPNGIANTIGASETTPFSVWQGNIAHAAIFDYELSPAQVLDLATV